ncbi:MAG: hypothetical protein MJ176_08220, partial [Treponema sp.]|nr:hypothetical protein [Treponema sp.]
KGKNNLKIGLNKNSVWISYFDSTRKTLAVFDANFSNVNNDTLNSCFGIPYEYEGEIFYSVNIQKQCMDENENIYLLSYNYDHKRYSLYRCAPPYKDPVCLVESIDYYGNDPLPILYDSATDSLIVILPNSKYRTITNASTSGKIDNFNDGDPSDLISDFKINPSNYSPADMSAVYNNEFYWIKTDIPSFPKYYILYKSGLEEGLVLYKYDNQLEGDEKFSGVLINNMKSAIYNGEFTALITDLVINKEGLFCLISDSRGMGYNEYSSSRGAVVQINHDLTDVSLYGWTDHAYIMNGIKQNANNEIETVQLCKQYTAKSLQEGFYGPQKIVGLKPKKLIFLDNGGWAYLDKDGLPTDKMEGHVIIFDLETHSWNSINGDFRILGSSFSRDFDRYANTNGYTSFTKTWQ